LESFEHKLQKFDPGIVWLDRSNRVVAMNGIAHRVLGANYGPAIGREITQLHPEKSRDKIRFLLQSSECPADSPPPMTMMINIPDSILLIKVSRMWGEDGRPTGTCMIFYDVTEVTTRPRDGAPDPARPRQLLKLPVYKKGKVVLLGLEDVIHFEAAGHYTKVYTRDQTYLSNLSLSDLETRLDTERFVRVHRRYMINVDHASALERDNDRVAVAMHGVDDSPIPVSRSNVQRLKVLFGLS